MSFHNILTIVIAMTFLVISMILSFIGIRNAIRESQRVERRLAGGARFDEDADIGIGAKSRAKRNLISQFGSHLTLPDAKEITRLRFMLAQAGYFEKITVKSFLAARVICLFGPVAICLSLWGTLAAKIGTTPAIAICFVLVGLGLLGPEQFIRVKARKRTEQCRKGFPDMLDLMTACVEAGLGMDAALVRVGHELGGRYPSLKQNLDIMNLELRAGRERNEAMLNFADRLNLEEAKALAIMLKQAEEMGSSVGQALRTFSDDMRHKRMMKAEEKAAALSAKLTVPLILFIFPTIMVMLMLPAGIRIMGGFT